MSWRCWKALRREVANRGLRLYNGPEFFSKEVALSAFMRGATLDFRRPGKPTDNAWIESLWQVPSRTPE
jgi:transposase InsO family protein